MGLGPRALRRGWRLRPCIGRHIAEVGEVRLARTTLGGAHGHAHGAQCAGHYMHASGTISNLTHVVMLMGLNAWRATCSS